MPRPLPLLPFDRFSRAATISISCRWATMRIPKKILFPLFILVVGCAVRSQIGRDDPMVVWRNDNPVVRKIQEEETVRYFPQADARKHLKKLVGEYVSIVCQDPGGDSVMASFPRSENGRAVAISSDGYYLTAYHVVRDLPFFLYQQTATPDPERGIVMKERRHVGRLVWGDPDLDIALLKFNRTNVPHIEKMRMLVQIHEVVYSADDEGWGAFSPAQNTEDGSIDMDSWVGNGSFFAAGEIVSSGHPGTRADAMQHITTLVARGAMSGAPLITAEGELCGVIVGAKMPEKRNWFDRSVTIPRTYASMIDPQVIREKIRADRRK
jgi:hypothetical protein